MNYDSSYVPTGLVGDDVEFIRKSQEHFAKKRKREEKPFIINIFGGPGAGKSTTAALVFGLLKLHGVNAELITEFAKDLAWEKRNKTFENQYYIWAKQYHKLWRVSDQVDVIVTDSPLLLSLVYGEDRSDTFKRLVLETTKDFNNKNYYLLREKAYNPAGRNQTEEEAVQIDDLVLKALMKYNVPFLTAAGSAEGANYITLNTLEDELSIKFTCKLDKIV